MTKGMEHKKRGGIVETLENPLAENEGYVEIIEAIKESWRGDFLSMDRIKVTLPNGKTAYRDVLRHPGAVAILVVNEKGEVLLERQYRTPVEKLILEIPAGKLEEGEAPQDSAHRELFEETGMTAQRMEYLGDALLAPGYSDEVIRIYLAKDLTQGQAEPDEDEFLDWGFYDLTLLEEWVRRGLITDAKTLAALYYYRLQV